MGKPKPDTKKLLAEYKIRTDKATKQILELLKSPDGISACRAGNSLQLETFLAEKTHLIIKSSFRKDYKLLTVYASLPEKEYITLMMECADYLYLKVKELLLIAIPIIIQGIDND